MIRVLLVDDQDIVVQGLKVILKTEIEITVAGIAHNGAKALDLIESLQPDLVLMDLKMPIMNGIDATRTIRERYPDIFVLVLTTFDADEWVFDALRAGASGYLLKDSSADDIIAAIKGTVQGRTHIDPAIADKLLILAREHVPVDTGIFSGLSERELHVLKDIARGFTTHQIAQKLNLSEGTMRNIISVILNKLAVEDRTQAAALAWHHGLVSHAGI